MSRNLIGAALMVASMVCFTINDTFLKLTEGAIPLPQLIAMRGAMASVLFVVLALALGQMSLKLGRRGWAMITLRAGAEIGAAYFFLSALFNMPLANATAIIQALPLTIALGAWLFFGERFGWRRVAAIVAGFAGMLLIVRPGADGFSIWSLYALVAVLFVTARDLITRLVPASVPSVSVAMINTVMVAFAFFCVSLAEPWVPVSGPNMKYLAFSTIFIVGAYFFSVQVMRVGEISFVAPFRYASLLAALVIGWAVWEDWPDALTLLGAGLVVGAGLFMLWRERVSAR